MFKTAGIVAALSLMATASSLAAPLTAFDVAEDMSRFTFDEAPVDDNGLPAFGNAFMTQGYIYPAGTLDGDVEGTLPDGSPAFPDKVIGTWTCDGYFVGKGMLTETGPIVMTRQVYHFNNGDLLISHGPELVDIGVEIDRPITGGTGEYVEIDGAIQQVMLGMSEGYGVRLQFTLDQD